MTNFNPEAFEHIMATGVQLHDEGRYSDALALSLQAYDMAPTPSSEKGRAARDTGARYDRLGDPGRASVWADIAYETHNLLVEDMEVPTREALRERAASGFYVVVHGIHRAIDARRNGTTTNTQKTLDITRQVWSDLAEAKKQAQGINRFVDQYEINAAHRVSIAESRLGERKRGFAIGVRAVALSVLSESPLLDTATEGLDTSRRIRAKVRALAGGVIAVGVSVLATKKDTFRNRIADALTEKTI